MLIVIAKIYGWGALALAAFHTGYVIWFASQASIEKNVALQAQGYYGDQTVDIVTILAVGLGILLLARIAESGSRDRSSESL